MTDTLIVKAYRGRGKFSMWPGVVRVDRLDPEEERGQGEEQWVFKDERPVPDGAKPRPWESFLLVIQQRERSKEGDGVYFVYVKTQFGVYIMNSEGKTVDSFD